MSNIPEVMGNSADNIRRNFERLGDEYIFSIINDINTKQPMITDEIYETLEWVEVILTEADVKQEIIDNILDNLGYRMFAIIKSLYIQEEVNDLEEQAAIHVGPENEQN